jgi:hypothetical protein
LKEKKIDDQKNVGIVMLNPEQVAQMIELLNMMD